MRTITDAVLAVAALVAFIVAVAAVLSFVVQWAWAGVMVGAFGFPALTLLQAFQLNLLTGMLLKSTQTNNNSNKR